MKKLSILILTMLFSLSGFAQKGKYNATYFGQSHEGYLVKANFDTLKGYIFIDQPYVMATNITFNRDGSGKNGSIFRPGDVIMFEVATMKWYSTKHCAIKLPPDPKRMVDDVFVNAQVVGPLKIFDYYFVKEELPAGYESTGFLETLDGELVDISAFLLGFKSKMPDYVKGHSEMINKIEKKEKGYKFMNLNDVVREYNAWYTEKNGPYRFVLAEVPKKPTTSYPTDEKYEGEWRSYDNHKGITTRLSNPYIRYQPWDTEKTGDGRLSIGLQLKNDSDKNLVQLDFKVILYDKQGNIIKETYTSVGAMVFDPQKGHLIPGKYTGHYDAFIQLDNEYLDSYDRVEYELRSVKEETTDQ